MNTIFEANKKLKECFKTSDGKFFYQEDAAKNHAKTLENSGIEKMTRPLKVVASESSPEGGEKSLEEMTIADLKKVASEMEPPLEIPKGAKKNIILDMVKAAQEDAELETTQKESGAAGQNEGGPSEEVVDENSGAGQNEGGQSEEVVDETNNEGQNDGGSSEE